MGRLTVFRLMAMSVVFGLVFTTIDQKSDILLMIQTYFFWGGNLGSVVCKHCFAEENRASQISEPKRCQLCTEEHAGLKDGGLQCGANALFMEKFPYFQETCDIDNWGVVPETNTDSSDVSYCQTDYRCCITSFLPENITNPSVRGNNAFEDNLLLAEKYSYNSNCDISLIIGQSADKFSCNKRFRNSNLRKELNTKCSDESYYYNGTGFTSGNCDVSNSCCMHTNRRKSPDCKTKCKVHFEKRNWTRYGECCKQVKDSLPPESKFRRCGQTVCQTHLDYLKYSTTKIYNEGSWRANFVTIRGASLGGALCTYLKNLSIIMFIPILLHWILVTRVWLDDYRKGKTTRLSILWVLMNCYSQVRLFYKLIKYYKNERRLQDELDEHDLRVTSLESIFEAMLQVHVVYAIVIETEETLPSVAGTAKTTFSNFADVMPLVTFAISLASSSYGMSKYLLLAPIDNKPCDKLFSLKFVAMIFLNSFFVVRLYSLDNIIYSYYHIYPDNLKNGNLEPSVIEPLVPLSFKHGRLLIFFLPSTLSIIINWVRLKHTKADLKTILYNNPQLFILPGFSPFLFEKVNILETKLNQIWSTNQLQIWRSGSILNAMYIGIVPSISLVISEYARGITAIDFSADQVTETKYASASLNLLLNSSYANAIFGLVFVITSLIVMLMFFGKARDCASAIAIDCTNCKNKEKQNKETIKIETIQLMPTDPKTIQAASVSTSPSQGTASIKEEAVCLEMKLTSRP